jgi:glycosyltransferase involved in cell wall biosynthesis
LTHEPSGSESDAGREGLTLAVVLPNYNHAKFLPRALDGLLAQTRPADQVILIDDASTDNSVEIIESYLPRLPGVTFIRNETNNGIIRNMNRGLADARGDLIYFGAADDVIYPDFFRTGIAMLTAYGNAALFSARSDIMDADGRNFGALSTPVPLTKAGFIAPTQVAERLMEDDSWIMGNATIYRRSALVAAGGFPAELGSFTDGYVGRLLALTHGACFSPDILCAWRRMQGGYAWSHAIDRKMTQQTIEAVEKRMRVNGVFPAGYFERWKGRHIFAAERFALVQKRMNAKARGIWQYLNAALSELAGTLWLLATLRPYDIVTVIARRVRNLVRHIFKD